MDRLLAKAEPISSAFSTSRVMYMGKENSSWERGASMYQAREKGRRHTRVRGETQLSPRGPQGSRDPAAAHGGPHPCSGQCPKEAVSPLEPSAAAAPPWTPWDGKGPRWSSLGRAADRGKDSHGEKSTENHLPWEGPHTGAGEECGEHNHRVHFQFPFPSPCIAHQEEAENQIKLNLGERKRWAEDILTLGIYFSLPCSDLIGSKLSWFPQAESVLPMTAIAGWCPCPSQNLDFSLCSPSPAQLGRGSDTVTLWVPTRPVPAVLPQSKSHHLAQIKFQQFLFGSNLLHIHMVIFLLKAGELMKIHNQGSGRSSTDYFSSKPIDYPLKLHWKPCYCIQFLFAFFRHFGSGECPSYCQHLE